ncbi:MAG: hypothetical protein SFV22_00130, partial [Saprospiraceae bacterium]|nr:hypothetical protein [Saprospiraceae bacterium]
MDYTRSRFIRPVTLALFYPFAVFAQTDTTQNVILREATVTAGQDQTLGLGKLRAVEGVIVY